MKRTLSVFVKFWILISACMGSHLVMANDYVELAKQAAENKTRILNIKNNALNANSFGGASLEDMSQAVDSHYQLKLQIQKLFDAYMSEEDMGVESQNMNIIVTNYLNSIEPVLSLQLEQLIFSGSKKAKDLPADFMSDVFKQWALAVPLKSFTYIFGNLSKVPQGLDVQFLNVNDKNNAQVLLGPKKTVVWSRIIEVLSSKGPEYTYMETTKCQLGVTIYAKYRRALEVLGQSSASKSIQWPSFCLGLKIDDLYKVAGVMNASAKDQESTGYGFEDFQIRNDLVAGLSSFAGSINKDEVKRLNIARTINPFLGSPMSLIEALPVVVAYPEGFIDLKEPEDSYKQHLTPSALESIKNFQKGSEYAPSAQVLEEDYIRKAEQQRWIKRMSDVQEQLLKEGNSFGQAYLVSSDFAENLWAKMQAEPFDRLKISRDEFNKRLSQLEFLYFEQVMGQVVMSYPSALSYLLDGDFDEVKAYMLFEVFQIAKYISMTKITSDMLMAAGNINSQEWSTLSDQDKEIQLESVFEENALPLVKESWASLREKMNADFDNNQSFKNWLKSWWHSSLKSYSKNKDQFANKYKKELLNSATEMKNLMELKRYWTDDLEYNSEVLTLTLLKTYQAKGYKITPQLKSVVNELLDIPQKIGQETQAQISSGASSESSVDLLAVAKKAYPLQKDFLIETLSKMEKVAPHLKTWYERGGKSGITNQSNFWSVTMIGASMTDKQTYFLLKELLSHLGLYSEKYRADFQETINFKDKSYGVLKAWGETFSSGEVKSMLKYYDKALEIYKIQNSFDSAVQGGATKLDELYRVDNQLEKSFVLDLGNYRSMQMQYDVDVAFETLRRAFMVKGWVITERANAFMQLVFAQKSQVISGGNVGAFQMQAAKIDEILSVLEAINPGLGNWYEEKYNSKGSSGWNVLGKIKNWWSDDFDPKNKNDYVALRKFKKLLGYELYSKPNFLMDIESKGQLQRKETASKLVNVWLEEFSDREVLALLKLYRMIYKTARLQQQSHILDMPIKTQDGYEYPLYELVGGDNRLDGQKEVYLQHAVTETLSNISMQLKLVTEAKKIQDLSEFVLESTAINMIYAGDDGIYDVRKSYLADDVTGRNLLNITDVNVRQELNNQTAQNFIAFRDYHIKHQNELLAVKRLGDERLHSFMSSIQAPVMSQTDMVVMQMVLGGIGSAFSQMFQPDQYDVQGTNMFNSSLNAQDIANGSAGAMKHAWVFGSLLDVFILKKLLPYKLGGKMLTRYADANRSALSGFWTLYWGVFAGEIAYSFMETLPMLEEERQEQDKAFFTEVDSTLGTSISSFTRFEKISDIEAYREQVYENMYWGGAFLALPVGGFIFGRALFNLSAMNIRGRNIRYKSYKSDRKKEAHNLYLLIKYNRQKNLKRYRIYFEDLGLKAKSWDPKAITEAYFKIEKSKTATKLDVQKARVAYRKLMLHLFKEFSTPRFSGASYVEEALQKVYFGKANATNEVNFIINTGTRIMNRGGR